MPRASRNVPSTGPKCAPNGGLAGCAAFIAAPRAATTGTDLQGRSFLHSYDWRTDAQFKTAGTDPQRLRSSWRAGSACNITGRAVAPELFGGGNKLIHNVVRRHRRRAGQWRDDAPGGGGLPWQAVHDGVNLAHEPLRLSIYIEAPQEAISAILARHDEVRALFDNGWLHLFTLEGGACRGALLPGARLENDIPRSVAA